MPDDKIPQEEDVEMESGDELEELRNTTTRKRGRGLDEPTSKNQIRGYDSLADDGRGGPQRSVEGWIIFASNVHEEANEDDLKDKLSEYGNVKNLHFNLDRRTGYAKGYAIVQYETEKEAEAAIKGLDGQEFLGQNLTVDWCFVKGKSKKSRR
uniref:RNA-binding protein 8A n=1 Tax=Panagrellus redivivus TaxID=6233 RepID=A0A7E4VYE0_PANRE